jgi:PhnB protein
MASFSVFLFFGGDCRQALEFYCRVFKQPLPQAMTYGQNPGGAEDGDKDRILYASIPICGTNVMFSDCPSSFHFIRGNHAALTLGLEDEGEIRRIYRELSEGGGENMKLGKTFFSDLFGMVTDKFGIIWQISQIPAQKQK